MKSLEYYAVIYKNHRDVSDIYCVACLPSRADLDDDDRVSRIYADQEWDYYPICCQCGEIHKYVQLIEGSLQQEELHSIGYDLFSGRYYNPVAFA
jgi:hypothetical protein